MRYKEAVSYQCKCGIKLVVPFPSMQETPTLAPSKRGLQEAHYALEQEIIFHQNNRCPWMYHQRKKSYLATDGKVILPKNAKLI